jgi:hypothetical protein
MAASGVFVLLAGRRALMHTKQARSQRTLCQSESIPGMMSELPSVVQCSKRPVLTLFFLLLLFQRVMLTATHQKALGKIPLEDLRAFAVESADPS